MSDGKSGLQLRSLIKKSGELEISLVNVPVPEPAADEVIVRVEATPINPSDIGLLTGAADLGTAKASGTKELPAITAKVPEAGMKAMAGRLDESMPVGNEGAGVVIKAGSSDAAKALMGKTVSMIGGAMYAQYRCIRVGECMPLPAGTTAAEGASWFVNPLTALGMTETMRREGHKALVHTAGCANAWSASSRLPFQATTPRSSHSRRRSISPISLSMRSGPLAKSFSSTPTRADESSQSGVFNG
jgi:NADPH:quinone reductase-like Zn-dependent oxidoreductase